MSRSVAAVMVCLALAGPLAANARADRLRIYELENFKGNDTLYTQPMQSMQQPDANAVRVGSLKVLSGRWLLCEASNYSGNCLWASRNLSSLTAVGFKSAVGSLKSETVPTIMRQWGDRGAPSRKALVLFGKANYEGAWLAIKDSTPDFQAAHLDTHPGSMVLATGIWRVCTQPNYTGRCLSLTGSIWDLNEIFGSEIRSAERLQ